MAGWRKDAGHEHEHRFVLSRRLLLKMLVSCLVVTMLPLLLCNLQYHEQLRELKAREEQNVARYLSQRRFRYEEAINELDKVLLSVMSDADLRAMSIAENPLNIRTNLYSFIRAQKRITQIAEYYDILDNLILLNMRGRYAISAGTIYLRFDMLTELMEIRYQGYVWSEDLMSSLEEKKQPGQRWLYLPSRTGNEAVMVCANSLHLANNSHIVLLVLTPEKINEYLRVDGDMDVVIYNQDQQRLSGTPRFPLEDEQLLGAGESQIVTDGEGERYLVQTTISEVTGHLLCAVTPYSRIEEGLVGIRRMNAMLFAVVILCTLALCTLVTWLNMKPLDDMLRFLFGSEGINVTRTLNWKTIEAKMQDIFRRNDELTNKIENQRESLINHLIYELITNGNGHNERTINRIERLNLSVQDDYGLLVLELPRMTMDMEPATLSLLLHQCIRNHIGGVIATLDMTARRYIVLTRSLSWEDMEQGVERLCADVQEALQVQCSACGCLVKSLREVDQSYWNAVMTLQMHTEEEGGLMPLYEEHESSTDIIFPQRLEQEIMAAIISGNQEMLEISLNELYDLNNAERLMSVVGARLLWERISATVTMTLAKMKNVPEMLQLKTLLSLRHPGEVESRYDFTHKILAVLDSVFILTQKESNTRLRRSELGKRIVDYIQLHLSEPDLCLQMVADYFSLSSAYISSLVKDETGQSFSVYCERLRIANACEMLREGKQIQSVAEAVGYSSAHTFRRVFKKVVGILPSQYAGQ